MQFVCYLNLVSNFQLQLKRRIRTTTEPRDRTRTIFFEKKRCLLSNLLGKSTVDTRQVQQFKVKTSTHGLGYILNSIQNKNNCQIKCQLINPQLIIGIIIINNNNIIV